MCTFLMPLVSVSTFFVLVFIPSTCKSSFKRAPISILVRNNSWLKKHGLPNFEVIFHSRFLIPSLHLIRRSNLEFCVIFVEPGIAIYGVILSDEVL